MTRWNGPVEEGKTLQRRRQNASTERSLEPCFQDSNSGNCQPGSKKGRSSREECVFQRMTVWTRRYDWCSYFPEKPHMVMTICTLRERCASSSGSRGDRFRLLSWLSHTSWRPVKRSATFRQTRMMRGVMRGKQYLYNSIHSSGIVSASKQKAFAPITLCYVTNLRRSS